LIQTQVIHMKSSRTSLLSYDINFSIGNWNTPVISLLSEKFPPHPLKFNFLPSEQKVKKKESTVCGTKIYDSKCCD